MSLKTLKLPVSLNYIGAFLTMDCNLNCSYCINDPVQGGDRRKIFHDTKTLPPDLWQKIFNRIPFKPDLPITLQGGEPMMYWKGRGIGKILEGCEHYFDLLTNFAQQPEVFVRNLNGQEAKLRRGAPFQSIRVSYHAEEMNRAWKGGFDELVRRCEALRDYGFSVTNDKETTEVCIYMVEHPDNDYPNVKGNVLFETKPFLGVHNGELYGDYLYPHSVDMISRNIWPTTLNCECRTTELLIDPVGDVWDCHYHLYQHWLGKPYKPLGNMLEPEFTLEKLKEFHPCSDYGNCIGCDTKIKNNRFQTLYYDGTPHTSVEIRNIQWPSKLGENYGITEGNRSDIA